MNQFWISQEWYCGERFWKAVLQCCVLSDFQWPNIVFVARLHGASVIQRGLSLQTLNPWSHGRPWCAFLVNFSPLDSLRVNIFVQDLRETFIAMDVNGTKLSQRFFLQQSVFWRNAEFIVMWLFLPRVINPVIQKFQECLVVHCSSDKDFVLLRLSKYGLYRCKTCTAKPCALCVRMLASVICSRYCMLWKPPVKSCLGNSEFTPHLKGNFLYSKAANTYLFVWIIVILYYYPIWWFSNPPQSKLEIGEIMWFIHTDLFTV